MVGQCQKAGEQAAEGRAPFLRRTVGESEQTHSWSCQSRGSPGYRTGKNPLPKGEISSKTVLAAWG